MNLLSKTSNPSSSRHPSRWVARLFGSLLLFLLIPHRPALAATYHVEQRVAGADDRNDGSAAHPWKTISRAAGIAAPGDIVRIGDGVYRETVKISRSGAADHPILFEALDAANAMITGADRITKWTAEPATAGAHGTTWGYEFIGWNKTHTHPDDDFHLVIGRCEQVFVGGQPLRQVLSREQLSRGTFFVDLPGKRLYAWSADNRNLADEDTIVEASTRQVLWECTGDYVETRGLRFRYAANMAQDGAATFAGNHDLIQDCTFERANSSGASFTGQDIVVRHCTFADNGQLGFGAARAHRLLMSDCQILRNNAKGFDRNWEAGGDKLVLCRSATIEHCTFAQNRGVGIWFDIGNEDCTVCNCLIEDNEDAGIFDEISIGLHAADNVILGNGLADTRGAWGVGAGISLSSSPHSVIERNLLIANKEGFSFREADRSTPRIDSAPSAHDEKIWNHDEQIRHNVLAYNRDAQVRGWFDIDDNRHWPATMQEKPGGNAPAVSLEQLKLDLSDNLYGVRPGQALLIWGVPWKRNKNFGSLDDIRRELSLEAGSQVAPITFVNYAERDLRVPADSVMINQNCYPHGEVPGVRLGVGVADSHR